MVSLKELFPYVLLFNNKLSDLAVVNHSGNKKLKKFHMKKMEHCKLNGLDVFKVKMSDNGQK